MANNLSVLLDTNILIDHLRGFRVISDRYSDSCFVSSITLMELYYGIYRTAEPQSKLEQLNELLEALGCQILPVTDETVLHAARIKVACERAGRRQQDFDILIAATALEHDFTLVTRNTKHFEVVAGLRLSEN